MSGIVGMIHVDPNSMSKMEWVHWRICGSALSHDLALILLLNNTVSAQTSGKTVSYCFAIERLK